MSIACPTKRLHLLAATFLAVSATSLSAAGQPRGAVVAWSTYLRTTPAQTSQALDELEHDARVQVLGCSGRWCRVTDGELRGYVDRDALDLPKLPKPGGRPSQGPAPVPLRTSSVGGR